MEIKYREITAYQIEETGEVFTSKEQLERGLAEKELLDLIDRKVYFRDFSPKDLVEFLCSEWETIRKLMEAVI